jgi:hypothetical protein
MKTNRNSLETSLRAEEQQAESHKAKQHEIAKRSALLKISLTDLRISGDSQRTALTAKRASVANLQLETAALQQRRQTITQAFLSECASEQQRIVQAYMKERAVLKAQVDKLEAAVVQLRSETERANAILPKPRQLPLKSLDDLSASNKVSEEPVHRHQDMKSDWFGEP